MSSLGSYLSGLRQHRGLSIEEMARSTRVAIRYLDALETQNFSVLPAPVFTRGFIRAYCQAVGVQPEEALSRYAAEIGEPVAAPTRPASPTPEPERPTRGRGTVLMSFILLVVLGATLFAVTMILQSGREPREDRRGRPSTTAVPGGPASKPLAEPATGPTPAAPLAPAPEPRAAVTEPPVSTITAGDLATLVGGVTSPYRLVARVSELTWLRVRLEDGRITEATLQPGQVREWVSSAPFVLTVGNAGGVRLELNGRELPPLGPRGAVIARLVIPPNPQ
jgi:cytoskeleton protein RodZ